MAFCDNCHKNRLNMKETDFPRKLTGDQDVSLPLQFDAHPQAARCAAPARAGAWPLPFSASAGKKKKADTAAAPEAGPRKFPFDPTKLVWPSPPNIARVRWLDYFAGAKIDYTPAANAKPKATWMDRLAGGQSDRRKIQSQDFSLPADRTLRHRHRFQGPGLRGRSKSRSRLHLQHRRPTTPSSSATATKPTSAGSTASPSTTTTGFLSPTARCTAS